MFQLKKPISNANTECILFAGSVPAVFIMETIMQHVGESLGIPPETVKQKNLYVKGQVKQS